MKIQGKQYRSIWLSDNGWSVNIFDQRRFPWEVVEVELTSSEQAARAIQEMWTRGAPMIAMVGAYGLCLGLREDASDISLEKHYQLQLNTRPTAVNLRWALDKMMAVLKPLAPSERVGTAYRLAGQICDEDVEINRAIGENGLQIIRDIAAKKGGAPVNILTHCNAGWLATVDYGTATAPMYLAHDEGIPIHVWVDETRPRNQGGYLTALELSEHGIPHKVITDNAGGHYMQIGKVDMCIVGADRVTANGDVCNKIGTYLKALAAHDNGIPFYVALPYPTIDYTLASGGDIPIEERSEKEVTHIQGLDESGKVESVQITQSSAGNPGFDITPARLVTGYVTDKGLFGNVDEVKTLI
jgi:methylthioribose-1-phosphate isomerase